jgi:hypothetical protein
MNKKLKKEILDEFDELFPDADGYEVNYKKESLMDFLSNAIDRVREDERERIIKELENMEQLGFRIPWIDKKKAINKIKNN